MSYFVTEPRSGKQLDIDYFLEWRPRLWRRPFLHAIGGLAGLQNLTGKRVLEVGCRYGKMSSLFGIFGATVVGVDTNAKAIQQAKEEVRKHGIEDRVKILHISGDVQTIGEEWFDIVFTKSVLYSCKNLDERLGQFHALLRPDGRAIFVENYLGSKLEATLRYQLLHRRCEMKSANDYVGIYKSQLPIFQKWFDDLELRSFWRVSCSITGRPRKNL